MLRKLIFLENAGKEMVGRAKCASHLSQFLVHDEKMFWCIIIT